MTSAVYPNAITPVRRFHRPDNTALFRIAQEALTNVARHARATKVRIRLRATENAILLEVEDNGVGIKEEEIQSAKSLGILGMRERALSFGGWVTITGRPGEGTLVSVESPLVDRGKQDRETDR
jgi:signal transduction histidine kinase